MLNPGLFSISHINAKPLIFGGLAAAIAVMATIIFPFWNLIPNTVTEVVTVKQVDQSGCYVETKDHFVVHIPPCNAPSQDRTLLII